MQVIPGYVTKFVENEYDEVSMTSSYSKLRKKMNNCNFVNT